MLADVAPLYEACRAKLQVTISYMKETTGEFVTHTGGIYKIGENKKGNAAFWLWDVNLNDTIRQFLISNIDNLEVLSVPFIPPHPEWPIEIDGEIIP
jgi:hypothetical protein